MILKESKDDWLNPLVNSAVLPHQTDTLLGSPLALEPKASELCGVLADLRLLWWARLATLGQRGEREPDIPTLSQKQPPLFHILVVSSLALRVQTFFFPRRLPHYLRSDRLPRSDTVAKLSITSFSTVFVQCSFESIGLKKSHAKPFVRL